MEVLECWKELFRKGGEGEGGGEMERERANRNSGAKSLS